MKKTVFTTAIFSKILALSVTMIFVMQFFFSCVPEEQPEPEPEPAPVVEATARTSQDFVTNIPEAMKTGQKFVLNVATDIPGMPADSIDIANKIAEWYRQTSNGARGDSIITNWNNKGLYPITENGRIIAYKDWRDAGKRPLILNPGNGLTYLANDSAQYRLFLNDGIILNVRQEDLEEPKEPEPEDPVDQEPGEYHLNSGSDLANIINGVAADTEQGKKSNITINPTSGAVAIYTGQTDGLSQLLALSSNHNVTVIGDLVITAGNSRVVIPEHVIAALKAFGGHISMSGAYTFHVPVITDMGRLESVLKPGAYVSTNRGVNFADIQYAKPDTTELKGVAEMSDLGDYMARIPKRGDGKKNVIIPNDTKFTLVEDDLLRFGQPSVPRTSDNNPQFYMTTNPVIHRVMGVTSYTDSIGTAIKQRFSKDDENATARMWVKKGLTSVPYETHTDATYQLWIYDKILTAVCTSAFPGYPLKDENYDPMRPVIDVDRYLIVSTAAQEAGLEEYIGHIIPQYNNNGRMKGYVTSYGGVILSKQYLDMYNRPSLDLEMWGQMVKGSFYWMTWSDFQRKGKNVRQ